MVPVGVNNPYLLPRINLPQKLSAVILLLHYMRQPNTEAKAHYWSLRTILINHFQIGRFTYMGGRPFTLFG